MTTIYKRKVKNLKIHLQIKAARRSSKGPSSNDISETTVPVSIQSTSVQDSLSVQLDDIKREEKLLHDIIEMQKLLATYMEIYKEQNLKQIVSNKEFLLNTLSFDKI